MKIRIIISILSCLLFFSVFQLEAQTPCEKLSFPNEQVTLHLDRNLCLAGETIWFKAWCFLDGKLEQELSKVLYVEIFDETQKVVVQEKYLLENNKTNGSIQIPEDVPSKHYFLKAYTKYMRNFSSENFHYQKITIVNPFIEGETIEVKKPNEAFISESDISPPQKIVNSSEEQLQITLKNEKYKVRERVDFHINSLKPITAELSTVVRMQGLGNQPTQKILFQNPWLLASCQEDPYCQQITKSESTDSSSRGESRGVISLKDNQLEWLPETRGLTISGLIKNKKKENVVGALSMVSVIQEKPLLYFGTTNDQGAFTICLHDMKQQKDLFVGTPNEKDSVLVRNDFDFEFPEIATIPLQFDSAFHSLLESLNLHQQLKRVYPQNKVQSVFQPNQYKTIATNILSPDRRTSLDNFIKMSTMYEVFEEVIPNVSLRKKKGKDYLSVFNPKQQRSYDSPLILLDNVPIFNIEELLQIDPTKIEAVDVFDSDYILGDYTIEGIISIISRTDDFAAYKWGEQAAFTKFKTFTITQAFEQVMHLEASHYPDFRPVLYWQPELQIEQQQRSDTISFFAPDRPGVYEILVQGFTKEGELCFSYATFEVIPDM